MKRLTAWGVAFALLAGGWLITLVTPQEVAWRDGFPITGVVGEEIADRNVSVTITDVTLTDDVVEGSDIYPQSDGAIWVVIGITAQSLTDETEGTIKHATLNIEGNEYRPSDRVRNSMQDARIFVAAPSRGYLVFEIPEPDTHKTGELRLGSRWDVDNADTYLAFAIDLSAAEQVPTIEVDSAVVGY